VENVLQLGMHRREGIGKLASALKLRVQELQSGRDDRVGLKGMKAVRPYMKEIIVSDGETKSNQRARGIPVEDMPLFDGCYVPSAGLPCSHVSFAWYEPGDRPGNPTH
jgi:hypothetical protein